jgi:hypothetical protein
VQMPQIVKSERSEADPIRLRVGHDLIVDLAPERLRERRTFLAFVVPKQIGRAEIGGNRLEEFIAAHRFERDRALLVALSDQRQLSVLMIDLARINSSSRAPVLRAASISAA